MKKILILCGGSGPQALLSGLNELGVMKFAKVQVLINALDNGLSSGKCRQIFGGKLLGPSDVRKNAMTRYAQLHGTTTLSKFMNERFSCNSQDAESYVKKQIAQITSNPELLMSAADTFFAQPLASTIDYDDFSMSNLIYSGIAAQNNMSLYTAAKIISKELLKIEEDFILLNSDESVFINAVTASGKILTDEVDIDEWDDIADRIDSIFFTDPSGVRINAPALHEDAAKAIREADIIIYSSGTQWTSLIPTYATTGFDIALSHSKAAQYLVMNNQADTDMTGMTSADVIDVLAEFLPMENITTIINSRATPDMRIAPVSKSGLVYRHVEKVLSLGVPNHQHHSGKLLVSCILSDYFSDAISVIGSGATLLMDYDDTIVGRNKTFVAASEFNAQAIHQAATEKGYAISIVTGNSIRCIDTFFPGMQVFADNACNEYLSLTTHHSDERTRVRYKLKSSVAPELMFTQVELDAIISVITQQVGIDISKVTNKAFAGIGIKPLAADYRTAIALLIKMLIDPTDALYEVVVAGRTTIDIYKKGVSKMTVVNEFLKNGSVVYIGDEWAEGNDSDVWQASLNNEALTYVTIDDPTDTALFFIALTSAQ